MKALTGIDADRLEEEKRRGITIDLGFAHMDLPAPNGETLRLGFVDVPGHERFVRNMLAGVGGIDLVLLVIAADEAIKPQTREHFDILQLLGVRRGITVLTKSDAVDAETLGVVRLEVEEFLRGTFLDNPQSLDNPKSIVAVSSMTGVGLDDLKRAMIAVATEAQPRDSHAIARLVTYGVTCAALPVLRRRSGVSPAMFRVRGGSAIAVAALVLAVWLLAHSTRTEAIQATIGEYRRFIPRDDARAPGNLRGDEACGRAVEFVVFGAASAERPCASAFSFVHDGKRGRDRAVHR